MTFVLLWVFTLVASAYFVFDSGLVAFHHFWHRWEFFSAVSAALYNALIFASVFFLRRRGGVTLDDALGSGLKKLFVFFLRFLVPILLLAWLGLLVWLDRAAIAPLAHRTSELKIWVALLAFVSFLLGDSLILRCLGVPDGTLHEYAFMRWRREFKNHIFFVHMPFVLSYIVLLAVYGSERNATSASELTLQAFLGGASALEVLLQSTIHALGGLAE
jgi:hypothetical protein